MQTGFEILQLTPADAASFHRLPRAKHRDPFDRLTVWQAIRQRLYLVSRDPDLAAYKSSGLRVIW